MQVLYSPQRSDDEILYSFKGESITVYYKEVTDTFDFLDVPDGQLEWIDDDGNSLVETTLPFNPIVEAYRKDGVLYVKLRYFYDENATEEEKFPNWTNVEDLKVGVYDG